MDAASRPRLGAFEFIRLAVVKPAVELACGSDKLSPTLALLVSAGHAERLANLLAYFLSAHEAASAEPSPPRVHALLLAIRRNPAQAGQTSKYLICNFQIN